MRGEWFALLSLCAGCWSSDAVFPDSPPGASVEACAMPPLTVLHPFATPRPPGAGFPGAPACARGEHDVVIVPGCPSASCKEERVALALALSEAGYGRRFIVSGAGEAEAMAALLVAAGVEDGDVVREPNARHTDENIAFATDLMEARGWRTAVVASDRGHLETVLSCDANCCVRRGRLSLLDWPVQGDTAGAGHYVVPGDPVTDLECDHLRSPSKLMCLSFESRTSCSVL